MRHSFYHHENDDDDDDDDSDDDHSDGIDDIDDVGNEDDHNFVGNEIYEASPVFERTNPITASTEIQNDVVLASVITHDAVLASAITHGAEEQTTPRMKSRRRLDPRIPASDSGVVFSALSGVSCLAASSLYGAPFLSPGVRSERDGRENVTVHSGFTDSRWCRPKTAFTPYPLRSSSCRVPSDQLGVSMLFIKIFYYA